MEQVLDLLQTIDTNHYDAILSFVKQQKKQNKKKGSSYNKKYYESIKANPELHIKYQKNKNQSKRNRNNTKKLLVKEYLFPDLFIPSTIKKVNKNKPKNKIELLFQQ